MTQPRFDELIHPSTRLSIVALLAASDWVDFAFLRDELGMSDSALSKQLTTLADAGYATVERPPAGRRRRVRARLTPVGRDAFDGHVMALRAIIGRPGTAADRVDNGRAANLGHGADGAAARSLHP